MLNVLLLVVLGSGLFRRFYENSKVQELQETADLVQEKYNQGDQQSWDELYEDIFSIENRNVVVAIFSMDEEQNPSILYHSKPRNIALFQEEEKKANDVSFQEDKGEPDFQTGESGGEIERQEAGNQTKEDQIRLAPPPEIYVKPYISTTVLENLPQVGEKLVSTIQWQDQDRGGRISLVSGLDENLYLLIETPTEYIQSVADMAVLSSVR